MKLRGFAAAGAVVAGALWLLGKGADAGEIVEHKRGWYGRTEGYVPNPSEPADYGPASHLHHGSQQAA